MNLIELFVGVEPSEITLAFNQLINDINALIASVISGSSNYVGSFSVAGLPAGVNGDMAYATNGRKISEGAGLGTGVLVYYSAGSWRTLSTDANVQA